MGLRTKFAELFGEPPLPIKSTVGMVLDGITVSMTIPGCRNNAAIPVPNLSNILTCPSPSQGSPASR
jgi:hypothetical protein